MMEEQKDQKEECSRNGDEIKTKTKTKPGRKQIMQVLTGHDNKFEFYSKYKQEATEGF